MASGSATKKTTSSKTRTSTRSASSGGSVRSAKSTSAVKPRTASGTKGSTKSAARSASGSSASSAERGRKAQGARYAAKEYIDYSIYYEIVLWVVLAVSVLILLSLLGVGGSLGKGLAGVCFGIFGVMAYVLPFFLFFLTAFLISNFNSRIARVKAFGAGILFLTLCGVMQMILVGYQKGYLLREYYEAGAQYHTGGGFIGGALASFFAPAIGVAGMWLVLLILLGIGIVLVTQRAIFGGMGRKGRRMMEHAREERARRKAWKEEQEETRSLERLARQQDHDERMQRRDLMQKKETASNAQTLSYEAGEDSSKESRLPVTFSILPKEKPENTRVSNAKRRVLTAQDRLAGDATHLGRSIELEDWDLDAADGLGGAVFETQKSAGARAASGKKAKNRQVLPASNVQDGGKGKEQEAHGEPNYIELGRAVQEKIPVSQLLGPLDDLVIRGAVDGKETKKERDGISRIENTAGSQENHVSGNETSAPKAKADAGSDRQETVSTTGETSLSAEEAALKASRKPRATAQEIQEGISNVEAEIAAGESAPKKVYEFPPLKLLKKPAKGKGGTSEAQLRETAAKLAQVFQTFGVNVKITDVTCGPSVTRYELMPEMGVKVSKIVSLQDDIMLNLAASDIRIEAPIPGKAAVGIEVPNKEASGVLLRELLESDEFQNHASNLAYVVGKDIAGNIIVSDIARMPHLLIAGATGSGKSVFINTLIMSILYKASPEDVKLIMVDPKVVELSVYNGIPHLYIPVVTDPKKAAGALNWAVAEMDQRYKKFAEIGVRDLKGYNKRVEALKDIEDPNKPQKMPQIVIIVDELADLMMVSSSEVEQAICRLAQLARACGIHLVIATQRPSVDVITGLIKANMPSRIAFSVSSGVDSRTILDMNGAEKLLGNGDMLFSPQTFKQPLRVQGAYVSDAEVAEIVGFLKDKNMPENYDAQMEQRLEQVAASAGSSGGAGGDVDELFAEAGKFIIDKDKASIGMLQRWFKIGFNRAARIMDQLSDAGVVGPEEGTKPRKVMMSQEQFENYLEQN